MFSKKQKNDSYNQGFSLIELLITSAIITIVTAIVVVKHASFNNAVLLKNQTYEIALALREAQVYAVSAKGDPADFRARYGVFFDKRDADKHQVRVYIESEATGADSKRYNDSSTTNPDTVIETIVLDSRFEIADICVEANCAPNYVSVSFQRPNFDPIINPHTVTAADTKEVSIVVAPVSGSSLTRTITVTQTGQITVN